MKKEELIKSLKNVKMVIGNGYDLFCGLKTRYVDYFMNDKSKNEILKKWIDEFKRNVRRYPYLYNSVEDRSNLWVGFDKFLKANVWDFFFFLVSYNNKSFNKWKWCDIESEMLNWLNYDQNTRNKNRNKNFHTIYLMLSNKFISQNTEDIVYYLASVIYKKHDEKSFKNEYDFYNFLLDHLKLFEKNFGHYIYNLQFDETCKSFGYIKVNSQFSLKSEDTINKLCIKNNLKSIDSFNYGSLCVDEINHLLHNINGNFENPIFGIDSDAFRAPDPRYIFTKTSRRMELDMVNNETLEFKPFDNIIIFGSSLGVADYSYFFSIFDKLDITNFEKSAKIVFAFSVYDKNNEGVIKSRLRQSIFRLFQEYSIYKGNEQHPNRLLDSLTTQGKVILYQID